MMVMRSKGELQSPQNQLQSPIQNMNSSGMKMKLKKGSSGIYNSKSSFSASSHMAYQSLISQNDQGNHNNLQMPQSPPMKSMSVSQNPLQSHRNIQERSEQSYLYNNLNKQTTKRPSAGPTAFSAILQGGTSSMSVNQLLHQQQMSLQNNSMGYLPKLQQQLETNINSNTNTNGANPGSQPFQGSSQLANNINQSQGNNNSNSYNPNLNLNQLNTNNSNNVANLSSKNALRTIAKFAPQTNNPNSNTQQPLNQNANLGNSPYALAGAPATSMTSFQENILQPPQSQGNNNKPYLGLSSPLYRPPSNFGSASTTSNTTKNQYSTSSGLSTTQSTGNLPPQFSKNLSFQQTPNSKAGNSSASTLQISGVLSPSNRVPNQRIPNPETTPSKLLFTKNKPTPASPSNSFLSTFNKQTNNTTTFPATAQSDLLDPRLLPKIDKSKISSKTIGYVQAYGANTNQGLVRPYNEDRVSIILNMVKPAEKQAVQDWPNISYFAIYDGHGGANCADFLRDQLHFYIVKDEEFPRNPAKAIHNGFVSAEEAFIKVADSHTPLDKSGSCAIVVMLINDTVYVANLGDSRAVMSCEKGTKVTGLTIDHKPNFPDEEKRIIANGGKIYQSQIPTNQQNKHLPQFIKGPHRVLPGRLAVSRTMGDAEAKLKKYGGNPKVILCEPEVTSFKLSPDQDFIMLGCDGIFDKLSNNESIRYIWDSLREQQQTPQYQRKDNRPNNVHEYIGESIEYLIRQTLIHKSFDNLTVVIICLSNLEKLLGNI